MADTTIPLVVKALIDTVTEVATSILTQENIGWARNMHGYFSVLLFASVFVVFTWCDPPNVTGGPNLAWISLSHATVWVSIHICICDVLLT